MRTEALLAERNAAFLAQASALLETLPGEVYGARIPPFERGGIGAHLRHVLDHYDAVLASMEEPVAAASAVVRIDYDARERDPATERDLDVARRRLARTLARLESFRLRAARGERKECELVVSMDAGERGGENARARTLGASTVGRELQFLISHTVHHFALIAVALRLAGLEPDPDFGVAPSTLRFESQNGGACAR